VDFDTVGDGTRLRHSLILARQPSYPQLLDLPRGAATIAGTIATRLKSGWRPVRVSAATLSGAARYTALYERARPGSGRVRAGMALAVLPVEHAKQRAAARSASTAEVVRTSAGTFVAGAWYERLKGAAGQPAPKVLTLAQLRARSALHRVAGRYLRSLTQWTAPQGPRFIGLWSPRPRVTITHGPSKLVAIESATFRFRASDPFATFECQLGDDAAQRGPCSAVEVVRGLKAGKHTLKVWARTREGVEGPAATRTWTASKGIGSGG